jgi:hypothetical protein
MISWCICDSVFIRELPILKLTLVLSMAGTVVLSIAYGIEVRPDHDPYVDIGERALHAMAAAGNAGAYLVDTFPIRTSKCAPLYDLLFEVKQWDTSQNGFLVLHFRVKHKNGVNRPWPWPNFHSNS